MVFREHCSATTITKETTPFLKDHHFDMWVVKNFEGVVHFHSFHSSKLNSHKSMNKTSVKGSNIQQTHRNAAVANGNQ